MRFRRMRHLCTISDRCCCKQYLTADKTPGGGVGISAAFSFNQTASNQILDEPSDFYRKISEYFILKKKQKEEDGIEENEAMNNMTKMKKSNKSYKTY